MINVVRINYEKPVGGALRYIEASGLSTDTKPTSGIITGSTFLEVNTGDVYVYDEVAGMWNKL